MKLVERLINKTTLAAVLALTIWIGDKSSGAPLRFEKVSDHCYYLQLKGGEENIFAVVTDDGILLADPPSEPDLSIAVDALKRLSPKPVRWVVFSNPRSVDSAGVRFFAEQGAALLASSQIRALSKSSLGIDVPFPWLVFDRQIHLFPSNLEIRITAVQHKARTGADVILYIPAEKVLFTGAFFEAARYPDINADMQGNAGGWIDGLKQVVDSIPVLKPAITQAVKPDPKTAVPEKTLEEGIAVVSARGEVSNFQNMKDLLSACQKLRADITKSIKGGRSCVGFLDSSRADIYRGYDNFNEYAARLCDSLSAPADKDK
jgi:hypothetical protein